MKWQHRLWLILGAVSAFVVIPSTSATIQFLPSIAAETTYTDNLEYGGVGSSSDAAYRLSLDLPVSKVWSTGQFEFRYNPRLFRFRDEGALDHTDHFATMSIADQLSEKSNLDFTTSYLRTQSQGLFTSLDDPSLILTERVFRDRIDANLSYSRQLRPTWTWSVGGGYGTVENDQISGFAGGLGGGSVEDRDQLSASTSVSKKISKRSDVGIDIRFQHNDLEVSGEEEVHAFNLSYGHQLSATESLSLVAGFFQTNTEVVGADDRSGAFIRANYNREFRRVGMALFGGHRPTSGGNLPGTATDTNVGVSISGVGSNIWAWDVTAAGTRRDPADSTSPEIESTGLSGGVSWAIHPNVGLRMRAGSVQQSVDAPMTTDIDVFNVSFGLVWFPRGQQGRRQ
jgi:hypothetical protein